MFDKRFPIDEAIIHLRTKKPLAAYLDDLLIHIREKVNPHTVLEGLGELLDEKQKQWVAAHLVDEVLFQIQLKKEELLKQ